MKKIAIIIAFKNFRDEEYFETKEILEKSGLKTKTFSNEKGIAIGKFGGEVNIDETIDKIDINQFNAFVFIGGPGAIPFLDNNISYSIIKKCFDNKKLIAAICIAPLILAKSGILKNKQATVWSSNMDKSAIKILKENNAIFKDIPVVCDNNIITANGPEAIKGFARKIIDKIKEIDIIQT